MGKKQNFGLEFLIGHANGYAMTFFQVCWNVLKKDILNFFKYFRKVCLKRVCYFYYSYSQKNKGSECKRF